MRRRALLLLAAALLLGGCAVPQPSRGSEGPRLRCLGDPGRGGTYSSDRPLFFILCAESP